MSDQDPAVEMALIRADLEAVQEELKAVRKVERVLQRAPMPEPISMCPPEAGAGRQALGRSPSLEVRQAPAPRRLQRSPERRTRSTRRAVTSFHHWALELLRRALRAKSGQPGMSPPILPRTCA